MQEHLRARRLDWGDAPAAYPTLFRDNGARHVIREGFYLGASIDRDPNGQPGALANGDDTDLDGDDEDGVFFLTPAVPGVRQRLRVDASAEGLLDAFVDFNRDGDWDDAGEQVFTSEPLVAGMNFVSHLVPAGFPGVVLPKPANAAAFRAAVARLLDERPPQLRAQS